MRRVVSPMLAPENEIIAAFLAMDGRAQDCGVCSVAWSRGVAGDYVFCGSTLWNPYVS